MLKSWPYVDLCPLYSKVKFAYLHFCMGKCRKVVFSKCIKDMPETYNLLYESDRSSKPLELQKKYYPTWISVPASRLYKMMVLLNDLFS